MSLAGENGEAEKGAETFIGVSDIYDFDHFQKVRPLQAPMPLWRPLTFYV